MHVRILNKLYELLDVTWVNKVLHCNVIFIVSHSVKNGLIFSHGTYKNSEVYTNFNYEYCFWV